MRFWLTRRQIISYLLVLQTWSTISVGVVFKCNISSSSVALDGKSCFVFTDPRFVPAHTQLQLAGHPLPLFGAWLVWGFAENSCWLLDVRLGLIQNSDAA